MSVQTRPQLPVEDVLGIEETISVAQGLRRRDEYGPSQNFGIREFIMEFGISVGHVCLRCDHEFDVTGANPPDGEADCPRCDS